VFSLALAKASKGYLTSSGSQSLVLRSWRRRVRETGRRPRLLAVISFLLCPTHMNTGNRAWQYAQPSITTCGKMSLGTSRLASGQGTLSVAYVKLLVQRAASAGLIPTKIVMYGIVQKLELELIQKI